MHDSPATRPRRRARPARRPQRQQILIRRALALGGTLVVLILIVLGIRGCLDARRERALTDYARDVTQILKETEQRSKSFFGELADPGSLSVTEFVAEVNADRSAMDNYASRIGSLDAPGDMSDAQTALELVYALRRSAMGTIADKMSTALGEVGARKATDAIARQMQRLLASDQLYAAVARPEINAALAANGIEGSDAPENVFLAEGTKWLDASTVGAALASVEGAVGAAATPGVHGLGLLATSVSGTQLTAEAPIAVAAEGTPEVEVQVQNQGDSTENGVKVSVKVDGGRVLEGSIGSIAAGATETVTIPLTPAPSGRVTLEVEVQPVPGERVSSNNEASYTVEFG